MTEDQYEKAKSEIEQDYKTEFKDLARHYAESNSAVEIGDIIEDHVGRIKVEEIYFYTPCTRRFPSCKYKGTCVTTKGKFYKSMEKRVIYQPNIKV